MLRTIVVVLMALGFGLAGAFAQKALEVPDNQSAPYPAEWPKGPGRDSVPAWAAPGKIRFSRWDGGRIETAKAFLSGWPGLNPPDPDILYTMTNWYDPKTIRFAKEAGLNLIWITLSVGFSNETEAAHRAEVQKYITECHRQGIHVMAYESIANMFWEDMFQVAPQSKSWIQLGTDGKPVPYGAAAYAKMGRITRYMADLSNPAWRAYLKKRIDLAIDSKRLFPKLLSYISPIDELAKLLLAASGDSPVRVEAPDGILYNVTEQPARKRTLVHLLNYTLEPVNNLQLKVSGSYRAARLVSPDAGGSFSNAPTFGPAAAGLQLPQLRIYSVIILDRT